MKTNQPLFWILFLLTGWLFMHPQPGYAQVITGTSGAKKVVIGKPQPAATKTVKAMPDLVIKEEQFLDPNQNNVINGKERLGIKFKIENLGTGVAKKVTVQASVKNRVIRGLDFTRTQLVGDIKPGETREISIPITAGMDLERAVAEFKIEVIEEQGFDAYPLEMKIETHPYEPPMVVVADAVFSTEMGGKAMLNYPIQLKVLIQNVGKGDADDIAATLGFPIPNCVVLGETDRFAIGKLKPGETKEIEFIFTANRRYTDSYIPVQVDLAESSGKYARDTSVSVSLSQNLVAQNQVIISAIKTPDIEVTKASLTSEVDKNIPEWPNKKSNKFALVIGNEEYTEKQQGIGTEANVAFARNDATIFREYLVRTLGFEESNVYLVTDATAGAMGQKIDLISKMAGKIGSDAEIVFYYAGHGLPDEATRIPYLIPVDVNAANLSSAIKLSDLYQKLSSSGAGKVTLFLDACFSGGGRNAGLLAARAVKVKPAEETMSGNLVVFSASTGEQSSLPYNKEKHGIFTYFLLKRLQETGGNINYGALADYLTKTVALESLRINQKDQDPTVSVSPDVAGIWQKWTIR